VPRVPTLKLPQQDAPEEDPCQRNSARSTDGGEAKRPTPRGVQQPVPRRGQRGDGRPPLSAGRDPARPGSGLPRHSLGAAGGDARARASGLRRVSSEAKASPAQSPRETRKNEGYLVQEYVGPLRMAKISSAPGTPPKSPREEPPTSFTFTPAKRHSRTPSNGGVVGSPRWNGDGDLIVPDSARAFMAMDEGDQENSIRVCCRFRPQNPAETRGGGQPCVRTSGDHSNTVTLHTTSVPSKAEHVFTFDTVFGPEASQEDVYKNAAAPIVQAVLQGFNGTIFAYGQTGSGKTYAMEGHQAPAAQRGIIFRGVEDLLTGLDVKTEAGEISEWEVIVSIVEIYQERVRDLLDPAHGNLKLREDESGAFFVEGAQERTACQEADVLRALRDAQNNRAVAATNMNEHSSRSHLVMKLGVAQRVASGAVLTGKLHLVDLAGSEMASKSGASGDRLEEAKFINKSLSALGNVIFALTNRVSHVPFRDSKLTRILRESIGGNAKTCMLITCSESNVNETETLSTLRFGRRAKLVKNAATVNRDDAGEMTLWKALGMQQVKIQDLRKQRVLDRSWRIIASRAFLGWCAHARLVAAKAGGGSVSPVFGGECSSDDEDPRLKRRSDGLPAIMWEANADHCKRCGHTFRWWRRSRQRHHCRLCGRLVCGTCGSRSEPAVGAPRVWCCTSCVVIAQRDVQNQTALHTTAGSTDGTPRQCGASV